MPQAYQISQYLESVLSTKNIDVYREESIKGVSNFKFINHTFYFKSDRNLQFVQKPQNTETIFRKEVLYKDTSDTHY